MNIKDMFGKMFTKKENAPAPEISTIDLLVNFIENYKNKQIQYDKINEQLVELEPDFPTYINMVNVDISSDMIQLVDVFIMNITGYEEICSHIIYESGKLTDTVDGEEIEYDLSNKEVLREFLLQAYQDNSK